MTHIPDPSHHPTPLAPPHKASTLVQLAGGLGIAGCCIGLLVFLGACFGFGASLYLSPLPLIMGVIGLVLTIVGGVLEPKSEGPSIAAGLFINLASIVGALLEMAAWLGWRLFA